RRAACALAQRGIGRRRCDAVDSLARGHADELAAARLSALDRRDLLAPRRFQCTLVDPHLGHSCGWRGFLALPARAGPGRRRARRRNCPSDNENQAMPAPPHGLPEPNRLEHPDAVVAAALPVLKASRGRAFLLFTTLRALAHARQALAAAFARDGLDYPLLVQ